MEEIISYIGTEDFYKNLTVEATGILFDIVLLSILVPLILWAGSRKERRFKKFATLNNLFGLCNEVLDQVTVLYEFDKIESEIKSEDSTYKYWRSYNKELYNKSYFQEIGLGNFVSKLFCIEHSSN